MREDVTWNKPNNPQQNPTRFILSPAVSDAEAQHEPVATVTSRRWMGGVQQNISTVRRRTAACWTDELLNVTLFVFNRRLLGGQQASG